MNTPAAPVAIAISGHTQVVGVIGWPVEHSVSPPMHNAAFRALGLDWCYVPFAVHPAQVGAALNGLRALGLRGINVTVPHKEAVFALFECAPDVRVLTDEARAIGAVNTVMLAEERLVGHNTDAQGFLCALRETGLTPDGCQALVLGAGGAARAIVYALARVGARATILNRTPERAQALAARFAPLASQMGGELLAGPLDATTVQREASPVQLVINTTPLGMWPKVEGSPWPAGVSFPAQALYLDLVYNPRQTRLGLVAAQSGARVADGLRMLVHQGAEAFRLWTGVEPPVEVMAAAGVQALGGR